MSEMFTGSMTQIVLATMVLCVLVGVAFFVVASFRDYGDEGTRDPQQTLANVDQMRARGDISDEEYRTIKASTRRQMAVAQSASDPSETDRANAIPPPSRGDDGGGGGGHDVVE